MENNFDEDDSSGASGDNEFYRLDDLNVKCEREIIADKESIRVTRTIGCKFENEETLKAFSIEKSSICGSDLRGDDNVDNRIGDHDLNCSSGGNSSNNINDSDISDRLKSEVGKLVPGKIIKNNGDMLIVDLDGVGMIEIENRFAATRLSGTGGYLFDVGNLVVRGI